MPEKRPEQMRLDGIYEQLLPMDRAIFLWSTVNHDNYAEMVEIGDQIIEIAKKCDQQERARILEWIKTATAEATTAKNTAENIAHTHERELKVLNKAKSELRIL